MRIISGKYKGRRLQAPKKLPVRPTTDMAKEALFNILRTNFNLTELNVLDLFSGTGNISYEFASRGTENIIAVDADYGCVSYIKKVSTEFEFPIQVLKSDVYAFLSKNKTTFDIIFADPPYNIGQDKFEAIPQLVFENSILEEDGMLIIEHSKHTKLDHLAHFSYAKSYGGNTFSFFEYLEEDEIETTETDGSEE